ncbi:methylated-DNA--[protein]-cysteine S-methyltransferase [Levilactobacillus bambusae]|uniref:methylated-DNA--[protein]-cysteine S-methyltransferase n=1 Tax=Levilactobacillus bambusae TaxID=2024736 RepID=A0A2V1MZ20_9LACO|nr:methylated-DNA--[protein]-cysteine S-methyltransferase [Levilactobacillus bambusae]PWG00013.1 methylated-DNA--[protein]-cysteine S-methyltransferase [Levilactobacillus bambusae]
MPTFKYDVLSHKGHRYYLIADETGVLFVGSPDNPLAEATEFLNSADWLPAIHHELDPVKNQLAEFLTGTRQTFDIPYHFITGTVFQRTVWRQLQRIPYGTTVSYQELAAAINRPTAVRAVASAVAANPLLFIVPCHRVILSSGEVGQYRGGEQLKRELLNLEQL